MWSEFSSMLIALYEISAKFPMGVEIKYNPFFNLLLSDSFFKSIMINN